VSQGHVSKFQEHGIDLCKTNVEKVLGKLYMLIKMPSP
jgi:hypothetical protein